MSTLASKVEVDFKRMAMEPSLLGASEPDWAGNAVLLPYTEREFQAVLKLIHRPWFERLWIRQEISFAKDAVITCGAKTMS
jgi:hypothetical protein